MVKVRAALALLVLVLFPVVVVALLVGIVAAAGWTAQHSSVAGGKILLYVGLPLVVAVFVAVRDVLRSRPQLSPMPELKRDEHPALWAEVETLAAGLATPAPSRIVVTPEVNASVREVRAQREMAIGLPLLVALTVPELRAVLGHELGHYGAGHTRLLRLTYRGTDALLGTVRNSTSMLRWVLVPYARAYLTLAAAANRAQEEEADGYSVRVAGPRVAADAMRMVAALNHGWAAFTAEYLPLAGPAHRRPRISEGLQEVLVARAQQLEQAVTLAEKTSTPAAGDSHPPFGQRIARFEALAADAEPRGTDDADPPAWTLLSGGWASLDALEKALLRDDDPQASWPELIELAGAAVCSQTAGHLARAAQAIGAARPTLAGYLDAIEAGAGARLVAPLVNPALAPEHRAQADRQVLQELLAAAVVDALINAGTARHRIDWSGPWQVVVETPGGEIPLNAEELVHDAVADPAAVPELRARLRDLGAALDHAAEATQAPDPDPVGLITRAKDKAATDKKHKTVDVLVCDTGLLVVPSPRKAGTMGSGLRHAVGGEDPALRRAVELVGTPHAQRIQAPGARWIDTDDIRAARLNRKPWGWTLRIHVRDAEDVVIASTSDTGDHGSAFEGIAVLLGARLGAAV